MFQGIESMNLDHEKWSDVNVISSLLKSFFRQLPEALVTDGKLGFAMLHESFWTLSPAFSAFIVDWSKRSCV